MDRQTSPDIGGQPGLHKETLSQKQDKTSKKLKWAGGIGSLVECLSGMHKAPGSVYNTAEIRLGGTHM